VLLWPVRCGDAVADAIELAELLDVDVEDLAWGGALITAHRLGRLERRQAVEANRFRMRLTVAAETPTSAAIALPVRRCRRKASTAAAVAGAVWLGDECGRDERSRKPSTPSASNRLIHLATVFGVVLNRPAAAAFDSPQSTTERTIVSRPLGVRGAFSCVSIRSSANPWRFADFRVPGPGRMDNLLKDHT
jgi:hypothetical protein